WARATGAASWTRCRRSRAPATSPTRWRSSTKAEITAATWGPMSVGASTAAIGALACPTSAAICRRGNLLPPVDYRSHMRLLAIETSTEACSVAVMVDGAVSERFEIAPRRHAELVLPWAETLLAEAGLRRADLDAIAVSRGPGAFTGVRLGISIAQGIALALDRPLVAVSTLAVLASGGLRTQREACRDALDHAAGVDADSDADVPDVEALPGGFILAAIDARMGEVYAGSFVRDGDGLRALDREVVAPPDVVELPPGGSWHGVGVGVGVGHRLGSGVGTGFAAADGALARRLGDRLASMDARALPRAADRARLAALALAEGGGIAPELVEPAYLRNNVALTLAEQVAGRERRG